MKESVFQTKVVDYFKSRGAWVFNVMGGSFQRSGIPDLLIVDEGNMYGLELKTDIGRPSELQKYNIREIRKAGGYSFILRPRDWEVFKQWIEDDIRPNTVKDSLEFGEWIK